MGKAGAKEPTARGRRGHRGKTEPSIAVKGEADREAAIAWEPFDWRALGPGPVVGVDEVGRGCLAGPVYACAAILPPDFDVEGVTDSKLLSETRREELALAICERAEVSLGLADEGEIADLNILWASLLAMRRAVEGLGMRGSAAVLVDGNQTIPGLPARLAQTALVKGDLRATPISAAAIVAKAARDRAMREIARLHPEYGFESNKGYGSAAHLEAIAKHGPCRRHRREFAGVREHWHRLRADRDGAGSGAAKGTGPGEAQGDLGL